MGTVLNEDFVGTEMVPLAQLGMSAWYVSLGISSVGVTFVEELNRNMRSVSGLPWSMSGVWELIRKTYPEAKGIDVYEAPPAICFSLKIITAPAHYYIKVFGDTVFEFALIAPGLDPDCNDNIYYRGETDYYGYTKKFKIIKEETLLDLAGDEDSLITFGTFVRSNGGWVPMQTEVSDLLFG